MHVAVLIKQVHNLGITRIQAARDESPLDFRINRLDEHALEEALRIKEALSGVTLTLVCLGPARVTDALRRGLGMGADEAIQVKTATEPLSATETAAALHPILHGLAPDLIVCGAMSEDLMQGMTGPALAAMLGIPYATQVVETLRIDPEARTLEATRDAGGGIRQEVGLPLPCLVTIQQGFNTPRYPNITRMINARSHPIQSVEAMAPPATVTAPVTGTSPPVRRGQGLRITGTPEEQAAQFVAYLKKRQVLQG